MKADEEEFEASCAERSIVLEDHWGRFIHRTILLGRDRDSNQYTWIGAGRTASSCMRLLVESPEREEWGCYKYMDEVDALIASLDHKGWRERDLKSRLTEEMYSEIKQGLPATGPDTHAKDGSPMVARYRRRKYTKPDTKQPPLPGAIAGNSGGDNQSEEGGITAMGVTQLDGEAGQAGGTAAPPPEEEEEEEDLAAAEEDHVVPEVLLLGEANLPPILPKGLILTASLFATPPGGQGAQQDRSKPVAEPAVAAEVEAWATGVEGAASRALRILTEEVLEVGSMVQEVGGRTVVLSDKLWPEWEAEVKAASSITQLAGPLSQVEEAVFVHAEPYALAQKEPFEPGPHAPTLETVGVGGYEGNAKRMKKLLWASVAEQECWQQGLLEAHASYRFALVVAVFLRRARMLLEKLALFRPKGPRLCVFYAFCVSSLLCVVVRLRAPRESNAPPRTTPNQASNDPVRWTGKLLRRRAICLRNPRFLNSIKGLTLCGARSRVTHGGLLRSASFTQGGSGPTGEVPRCFTSSTRMSFPTSPRATLSLSSSKR